VLAVAGVVTAPEPKGGTASASTARRALRRPDLSCVERHDVPAGELLTARTVPVPQSWRR
jgi:hypothetical protein